MNLLFVALMFLQSGLTATLTWPALDPSEMIASYNIYRSTTSGMYGATPYGNVVNVGPTLAFVDANLPTGTFFYIVKALNIYGQEGPQSNEVKAAIPTALTAPVVTGTVKVPIVELWIDGTKVTSGVAPIDYFLVIPRQTPPQIVTKSLEVRISQ